MFFPKLMRILFVAYISHNHTAIGHENNTCIRKDNMAQKFTIRIERSARATISLIIISMNNSFFSSKIKNVKFKLTTGFE